MSRKIQGYGWKPSLPDSRDLIADTATLKVLPEVDPRKNMQAPYDQGQLGSCTANSVAGAIEYNNILDGKHTGTPSRLDVYYGERSYEGTVSQDSGAFGRDGFKYANTTGWIPEKDWPYVTSKFAQKPPVDASHRVKIGAYKVVVQTVNQIKAVLSNNQTVAFGFTVYESFESQAVAQTGIMPVPGYDEKQLGGHEVLAVGYLKSEPNYVLVRNSWGTGWGLRGYFLMPWSILVDPHSANDLRTIVRPSA